MDNSASGHDKIGTMVEKDNNILSAEEKERLMRTLGPSPKIIWAYGKKSFHTVEELMNIGWSGYASRELVHITMFHIKKKVESSGLGFIFRDGGYELEMDQGSRPGLPDLGVKARVVMALVEKSVLTAEEVVEMGRRSGGSVRSEVCRIRKTIGEDLEIVKVNENYILRRR